MCLLRKYGEPLKLSSLTKCHTEGRRVRRDIKASIGSHGGTVGAWSDGDSLPLSFSNLYTKRSY